MLAILAAHPFTIVVGCLVVFSFVAYAGLEVAAVATRREMK